jgi:hypothetical protein
MITRCAVLREQAPNPYQASGVKRADGWVTRGRGGRPRQKR